MTNYDQVWGDTKKAWRTVERDHQLATAMRVGAWVGMVMFFVSGAFALLRAEWAIFSLLISVSVWLGCGIVAIRLRRDRRKFLKIVK